MDFMATKPNVLLVEDTSTLAAIYQEYLKNEAINLQHVASGKEAIAAIEKQAPQVILLDLKLPDMSGQDILSWLKKHAYSCAVIVITAHGSIDIAIEVMRLGADDFLEKPFNANRLITTLRNVLERSRLENIVGELQTTLTRKNYHGFIGNSLPMQAVYRIIDAVALSKASVFITGESGTGKEVCAEAIHKQGPRKENTLVPLNCAAIPRDLMESEIFGHVKGAFTGAQAERKGAAELADGGTLFLDEIGEMDLDLQSKLLRFIQTGVFQKVGSSKSQKVDVRFICATNRDPLEEVKAGRFREDLYYRLHVVPVHLPPLRDRGKDIIKIAKAFLKNYSREENKAFKGFSPEVEVILNKYDWPGNIRQLQNVIRNIVVLHDGDIVKTQHLPPPLDTSLLTTNSQPIPTSAHETAAENSEQAAFAASVNSTPETVATTIEQIRPLALVEKETIENAIDLCDGNIPKAAALLDVSPSTIYRKKQSWEEMV